MKAHEFVSNGPLTNAAVASAIEHCGGMGYRMEDLVVSDHLREPGKALSDEFELGISIDDSLADDHWRLEGWAA